MSAAPLELVPDSDSAGIPLIEAHTFTKAVEWIDRSGLAQWADGFLPAPRKRAHGGQPRQMTTKALLVGIALLAISEQSLILRDAARVLNSLSKRQRLALGLRRKVSERMLSRQWLAVIAAMEDSQYAAVNADVKDAEGFDEYLAAKSARAQHFLDALIDATLPEDYVHSGSYAVDASRLPSWARQNRKAVTDPLLVPDHDATWNGMKSNTAGSRGKGWFGYWLHTFQRVEEVGAAKTPKLVERMDLTNATDDAREAAAQLLTRMTAWHDRADAEAGRPRRPRGDILMDRGYSNAFEPFIWPVLDHGFTPVFDLLNWQLGQRGMTASGAVIIDGLPYSPRIPEKLRKAVKRPDKRTASAKQLAAYKATLAARAPYRLSTTGPRNSDGSLDFACPASKAMGRLRCSLKPVSLGMPSTKPTTDPALGPSDGLSCSDLREQARICAQQKARTQAEELPYWQATQYGSDEWEKSYNRRSTVEGGYGNTKNDATQDISRGNIRVMGRVKTAVLAAFSIGAMNFRLIAAFERAQEREAARTAPVKTRRPRRRTLYVIATKAAMTKAVAAALDDALIEGTWDEDDEPPRE